MTITETDYILVVIAAFIAGVSIGVTIVAIVKRVWYRFDKHTLPGGAIYDDSTMIARLDSLVGKVVKVEDNGVIDDYAVSVKGKGRLTTHKALPGCDSVIEKILDRIG